MPSKTVERVRLEIEVEVTINDPDVIERITGPGGDEWRAQMYAGLKTKQDVLAHLAFRCVYGGAENLQFVDGWADLPAEAAQMQITSMERSPFDA